MDSVDIIANKAVTLIKDLSTYDGTVLGVMGVWIAGTQSSSIAPFRFRINGRNAEVGLRNLLESLDITSDQYTCTLYVLFK